LKQAAMVINLFCFLHPLTAYHVLEAILLMSR